MDSAALAEIEQLKQLKARYCRLLDTKQWEQWRTLFTDDFVSDTSAAGGRRIAGADAFVAFTRRSLGKPSQVTAHQVHNPELELTSPATANGIWALEDVVRLAPAVNLRGYGHYTETYVKADGQWRIASSTLTRLREDVFNALFTLYIPARVRQAAVDAARRYGRGQS
ncbi:nuclear transport factor 2 family protein [Mycobacterium sp. MYCO198283]|uniref:nuclear transport factor 2 family protein n=1 Tax=Mycobacterium sp. MYCO198283 TaxID=2883505 RepID=UPI001E51DD5A|nr:nuclear transport factor 2 family protein [Mycobacterium sp. MYCO198283]MCG5434000.1 nuclear transport factor 2 family protein [Mycobacterium sp. MYCO198283]